MAITWSLTIDCARPGRLAEFWALALGYAPAGFASWNECLADQGVPEEEWDDGAFLVDPEGTGPCLSFIKVPEPKVVKNRVHLDVQVDGGPGRDAIGSPVAARAGGGRAADRRRGERDM